MRKIKDALNELHSDRHSAQSEAESQNPCGLLDAASCDFAQDDTRSMTEVNLFSVSLTHQGYG
jgi:hypothetical protein